MTWMDVLLSVIETAFELIVTLAIPYLFVLIKKRLDADDRFADSEKARDMLDRAEKYLSNTVLMVQQTFVDSLKAEGKFDIDAQKQAFEMAKDQWLKMMSAEMKELVLNEIGDIDSWLKSKIESQIASSKT